MGLGKHTAKNGTHNKKFSKLFFIGPEVDTSIDSLGDALIGMEPVEEVFVEDHILGYSARVRFSKGIEPKPASYFARRLGSRFGLVRDA